MGVFQTEQTQLAELRQKYLAKAQEIIDQE